MTNETKFLLTLPICKVDAEKRTVEGFATTEDIDKQNELVDFGASKEAFGAWQGNLREMHEPKAVGKAIEWHPDDEKRGIYVKAYISKGAQDTWEKIKDGTLKAFSIGGQTVNKIQQIIKDAQSGSSRNVTRITKYKLTELSLVDNPANPNAAFELVKSVNGVPTQTQLVEDLRKVIVSESHDVLEDEVNEHQSKAESLIKKVLTAHELEKLENDQWGVVRKYAKGEEQYIERFLPMPDKVHAVRALAVMDGYNLTKEEQEHVHEIAKSILGSDYDFHSSTINRGGESKKMSKEILEALQSLTKRIETIEARFSKADMDKDSKVETQETGNVAPNDGTVPVKGSKSEGAVPKEGEKQNLEGSKPASPSLKTQEEGNVAPVKKEIAIEDDKEVPAVEEEGKKEDEEVEEKPKEEEVMKAKNPATSSLKTQDDKDVPPVKKAVKKLADEGDEDIKKVEKSDLLKEIETLRKRVDTLEQSPLPRKYRKIEKSFGPANEVQGDGLAEDMHKAAELRRAELAGRRLTLDEKSFMEKTLQKSLDSKFNKSL